MSLFQRYSDVFNNWDVDIFRNIHHEDYMFLRETQLLSRDEHVEIFTKLASDPDWNWDWFKSAKVLYEDDHVSVTRWEDNGELVTNTCIIKDGLCWRSIVVRNPKED